MFCNLLGLLPLFFYFEAISAQPQSTGNAIIQTGVHMVKGSDLLEEEDEDDGKPLQKPESCGATSGKSLAQTGMKRERAIDDFMEEEDSEPSRQQRWPRRSSQTYGMSMLQSGVQSAAKHVAAEVVEEVSSSEDQPPLEAIEEVIQEDSFDDQLPLEGIHEDSLDDQPPLEEGAGMEEGNSDNQLAKGEETFIP